MHLWSNDDNFSFDMKDTASVEMFIRNWSVYQKVIAADHMQHRKFAALTRAAILKEAHKGPLTILDLGCGDADLMATHLKHVEVVHYTGYDFSPTALQLATISLSFLGNKVTLVEGPMEEKLPEEKKSFDLVHSSFAIHHLTDDGKAVLFDHIAQRLKADGLFIYVDTYRQPGIGRETCLSNYLNWMKKTWDVISAGEKARIEEHVSAYDHPADLHLIGQIANDAGLEVVESVTDDPRHLYISFRKK